MGRFGNVWKSGKFSSNTEQKPISKEVISLMHEVTPSFGLSESYGAILTNLRTKRGLETGRWLNTLTTEVGVAQEKIATASQQNSTTFDEIIVWMDQLFVQFRDLAFEFNKSAINTDLLIAAEQPQLHEKRLAPAAENEVIKIYRGRVTTSQWALALIGQEDRICIYLIPAAMLLNLMVGHLSQQQFPPFIEI
jgi:hypothetical protein